MENQSPLDKEMNSKNVIKSVVLNLMIILLKK